MKNLVLLCVFLLLGLLARAENNDFVLTVELAKKFKGTVAVEMNGERRNLIFEDGSLSDRITYKNLKPGYARIYAGTLFKTLYFEPGKDLKVKIIPTDFPWVKHFEFEGKNADINAYLVKDTLKQIEKENFKLSPEDFIKKQQDFTAENIARMKSYHLDGRFAKMEEIRIKYLVHKHASRYMTQHFWEKPTDTNGTEEYTDLPQIKAYIKSLLVDDVNYWGIDSYREFCINTISALTRASYYTDDFKQSTVNRCEYVLKNFKDKALVESLIYRFLEIYLIREEGKPLGSQLEKYFTDNVKDVKLIEKFQGVKQEWAKMQEGSVILEDDSYIDGNGKVVSFSDLKGKYIYIDVWATWCGPCCAEIPYLKELEQKLHGKNICFVSISLDQNKSAWLKKVRDDEMTGIQLHGGPDAKIQKDFRITGIPRFILLDREGKLVNADMTRPSAPQTEQTLKALEGI